MHCRFNELYPGGVLQSLHQVTVIVVTYNSAHCLPGLHPLLGNCPYVIVSDNASTDGTASQARQMWPHATVLAHEDNLGFGAANNRALSNVRTTFALLLNPDCELSADQLQNLLQVANQYDQAALISPQLINTKGRPEISYRWPSTYWVSRGPEVSGPASVGFVSAAALLLRLKICRPVGFFDEDFFLYYEDDDLCLRLFKARLSMIVTPEVRALHRSRRSVKGGSPYRAEYLRGFHHVQSKLLFVTKHIGAEAAKRLHWRLAWQTALALPFRILVFSPRLIVRMWGRFLGLLRWVPHKASP
jgi:N-acetylglucosaminyl-diphospho-decaprenol L-rhamnosyltransferase